MAHSTQKCAIKHISLRNKNESRASAINQQATQLPFSYNYHTARQ